MANNNIEIRTTGEIGVCCVSDFVIKKPDGSAYTVNDNIGEALGSDSLMEFRNKLRNGEKVSECKRCWELESAGSDSKRTIENRRPLTTPTSKYSITSMDLKPGNICNLKCMICYSGASSKWIKEEIDLNGQSTFRLLNWGDNDGFSNKIIDYLHDVEYIEISGGETFMISGVKNLLHQLYERDFAKNITIQIHTNATIYPSDEYIELLKQFKHVLIVFSIDGINESFEYQRFPGKWNDVVKTVDNFLMHNEFELKIGCSISIFNILDVGKLFEWSKEKNLPIFLNMVSSKFNFDHLSIRSKDLIKNELIKQNTDFSICDNVSDDNNWIMNILSRDSGIHNDCKYVNEIQRHDDYRKIYFSEVSPIMWKILKG